MLKRMFVINLGQLGVGLSPSAQKRNNFCSIGPKWIRNVPPSNHSTSNIWASDCIEGGKSP